MSAMESQTTSPTIAQAFIVYSGADQRKHQSSASLAFVRGIHRSPVNSPPKGPVTRKMFPFDDVIMCTGTEYTNTWTDDEKCHNISCHNYNDDKLRCHQWRQSWYPNDTNFVGTDGIETYHDIIITSLGLQCSCICVGLHPNVARNDLLSIGHIGQRQSCDIPMETSIEIELHCCMRWCHPCVGLLRQFLPYRPLFSYFFSELSKYWLRVYAKA